MVFVLLCSFAVGMIFPDPVVYAADAANDDPANADEDDDEDEDNNQQDNNSDDEDMTGKIVIVVRKPTDFRVYSKTTGVFVVEAKNKGEIDGYDIRVRKVDSKTAKNFRAVTTKNLRRRFIGAKPNDRYMVKVRAFRTINNKDYPSKWTKELQVIVWPRDEDNTDSSTRITEFPGKKNKKKKK